MSNWSTDSNWYYCFIGLVTVALWLWRDLRDANKRKNDLHDIAQNLASSRTRFEIWLMEQRPIVPKHARGLSDAERVRAVANKEEFIKEVLDYLDHKNQPS